jgi:Nucleotidyl transferase AbiEii toxin, Type IV TA system
MRSDLSPLDQLLVEGAFTADDMSDLVRARQFTRHTGEPEGVGGLLRSEAEVDYALARFVAANCAVAEPFESEPTPFVLKGGLAIYGCFRGKRRSRDADMSPSHHDVEVDGRQPLDLLNVPRGMRLLDPTQETDEGWKVPVEFGTTTGDDRSRIICDLNKWGRAIRRPPAISRPFESPFTSEPVTLWVACAEEIVGEKIGALLRRRNGRLRDIYDIGHLLTIAGTIDLDVRKIREVTVEALQDLLPLVNNIRVAIQEMIRTRVNERDDLGWIADEIRSIGYNAKEKDWRAQVTDVVPGAGTPREETDHLLTLWYNLRLLERA